MTIEAPVAFLPRLGLLTAKLFAKVFTNEGMRIKIPRFMRIFPSEEFRASQSGKNRSPLSWAQIR